MTADNSPISILQHLLAARMEEDIYSIMSMISIEPCSYSTKPLDQNARDTNEVHVWIVERLSESGTIVFGSD